MEINSFNEIFSEAARLGLLLDVFTQTDRGLWRARWRRLAPKTWHDFAEHDRPFDALLQAFRNAEAASSAIDVPVKVDPNLPPDRVEFRDPDGKLVAVMTDLFA